MSELSTIIDELDKQLEKAVSREDQSLARLYATEQEQLKRYLLTGIGKVDVAIPIDDLFEVGEMPKITSLPNLPQWLLGVVNLREEIISVVSLRGLIFSEFDKNIGNRLAVLRNDKTKIGISVDRIFGTVSISDSSKILASETPLGSVLPDVFPEALLSDGKVYTLVAAEKLLNYDKLINC